MTTRTDPPVIEFRGSDPTPNSLLLIGLRPDPTGPRTVADRLALLAETRMNVAAKRAAAPVAKEPKPCSRCNGTGRAFSFFDGCGWEQRPARAGEEAETCRACGGEP